MVLVDDALSYWFEILLCDIPHYFIQSILELPQPNNIIGVLLVLGEDLPEHELEVLAPSQPKLLNSGEFGYNL